MIILRGFDGRLALSVIAMVVVSPYKGYCQQPTSGRPPGSTFTNGTIKGSTLDVKSEPALQQTATLDVLDRPIGEALRTLSLKLPFDVVAAHRIEDQRVSLHIKDQPLHLIMTRLAGVLSHSPTPPRGYHWEKLPKSTTSRLGYRLWRDEASLDEERDALDFPHKKAIALLREYRRVLGLSPEQLANYKGDLPQFYIDWVSDPEMQPFNDTLKQLSGAQVSELVNGVNVPIDTAPVARQLAQFNAAWHAEAVLQAKPNQRRPVPGPKNNEG